MTMPREAFMRSFKHALLGLLLLEAVSFWGFLFPEFSSVAFLLIVGFTTVLAAVDPTSAMLVVFAELFVGSQGGYLVQFGLKSGLALSLRIGLFLAVFGMWAARNTEAIFRKEKRPEAWGWFESMRRLGVLWPYLALMIAFALAGVRGLLLSNGLSNVFFDANGYAYFALVPAIVSAFGGREAFVRLGGVLSAATVVSVGKALFVEFLFSHRLFFYARYVYVWVRDTRVGEITLMTADFYRVFFQSQVWTLFAAFPLILVLAYSKSWRSRHAIAAFGMMALVAASMLLSLSRSFWFGAGVTALVMFGLLAWSRAKAEVWFRLAGAGLLSVVAGFVLIVGLYSFPWPDKTGQLDFAGFLGGRALSISGEAAANSRWALLPILNDAIAEHPVLGSGFGRTVTYTTSDPRLLADNPIGEYETFAFEWGYHDLMVKLGAVGTAAYAWLLASTLLPLGAFVVRKRGIFKGVGLEGEATKTETVLVLGALLGVTSMLVTNVFSPYLNHPLGIGMLGMIIALAAALRLWRRERVTVRLVEDADVPVVARLHRESWLSTYVNEGEGVTEDAVRQFLGEEEAHKKWWLQNHGESESGECVTFLAADGEKFAGICRVSKKPDGLFVHALYVDSAYEGAGVGQQLMDSGIEWLGEGDILLDVVKYNKRALNFYQRYGFEMTGEDKSVKIAPNVTLHQYRMVMKRQSGAQ